MKKVKLFEEFISEKVDMEELQFFLNYYKKKNPGKKVTYTFTKDTPKGYTILVDGKVLKESINESNIKVGDTVIRKFASEDMDSYVVLSISNGMAGLKNVKTGKKTGMFLNDLLKESEVVYHQYDFLGMQAQAANMTREEWIAHYGTPEIGSGIDE